MADTVEVRYLYPTNWDENLSDDVRQGFRRVIIQMTNTSDGTGESDVIKLDLSTLRLPGGATPQRTAIEWIDYSTYGMGVLLEWDRTPQAVIAKLPQSDSGRFDWTRVGGNVDPGEDDATGDILLTTIGHTAADTYDITMSIKLKWDKPA